MGQGHTLYFLLQTNTEGIVDQLSACGVGKKEKFTSIVNMSLFISD